MSLKSENVQAVLSTLTPLENRTPETTDDQENAAFASLFKFNNGEIFTGSFSGDSPWERHSHGDELVQIIAGETDLTIMTEDGPKTLHITAGSMTVVPQGMWHRFHAPKGVSLLTATPLPTDHTAVEDPRALKD